MEGNKHEIRFITSHYDEMFRIPDGGLIEVDYPDRRFCAKCEYLDDYHTKIGLEVFHICQFAEILERGGATCRPEPELLADEAVWQIGYKNYLAVQRCEDGWDYTLFDQQFHEADGGQLDMPELSILQAREAILEDFGLQRRNRIPVSYDFVMEKSKEAVQREMSAVRESALEKLSGFKDVSKPAAAHEHKQKEAAR